MPLAKVTTRASPSRRASVRTGAKRWWGWPTSRTAAHTVSASAAMGICLVMEAMRPACGLPPREGQGLSISGPTRENLGDHGGGPHAGRRRHQLTHSEAPGAPAAQRAVGATILAVALVGPLAGPSAAVDTDMSIDITAVDFGSIAVGASSATVSVTLTNTGGDPFGPINIFGGAPPTAEFGASQSCQAVTLPAGGSCTVNYTFVPGAESSYTDTSSFTVSETASQSDGEDFSVTLAGVGGSPPTTTASTDTPTTTAPPPPDEMGGEGSVAGGGDPATDASSAPGGTTLPGRKRPRPSPTTTAPTTTCS